MFLIIYLSQHIQGESTQISHLDIVSDGHLDLYARFNADGGLQRIFCKIQEFKKETVITYNLFHDLRGAVQINKALVDSHLKAIPSIGTYICEETTSKKTSRHYKKETYPLRKETSWL
mgnify:CR=1 FL=1